jgi:peroxiredoxin
MLSRRAARTLMCKAACALAMLAAVTSGTGQSTGATSARTLPGPGIGAHIPEFQAADQHGVVQSFASICGRKGAVIYFHRSADWCIYCKMQLVELEASRAALSRNGYGLVAISFDGPQALKAFAEQKSLGFALLSDPDSQIIRRFGLLDPSVAPNNPAYGVPLHGSLLVDESGVVRARFFEPSQGHTSGVVLTRLFTSAYNTHEKLLLHDHVRARYSASTLSLRASARFELALEVTPKDGMVLYAEDVGGTRVTLSWEMDTSPAFQAGPVDYPQPVELLIASQPRRMHRGPVQLKRSIVLTSDAELLAATLDPAGDFVLSGTLTYQACRADQCYSARTVPLRWRIQVPLAETRHAASTI